jgi:hypothetical protein
LKSQTSKSLIMEGRVGVVEELDEFGFGTEFASKRGGVPVGEDMMGDASSGERLVEDG